MKGSRVDISVGLFSPRMLPALLSSSNASLVAQALRSCRRSRPLSRTKRVYAALLMEMPTEANIDHGFRDCVHTSLNRLCFIFLKPISPTLSAYCEQEPRLAESGRCAQRAREIPTRGHFSLSGAHSGRGPARNATCGDWSRPGQLWSVLWVEMCVSVIQ